MILSNSAIFAALDEKLLVIDPEPAPRNPADDPDADWPYGTSAIDLRLGDEVSWFNDGLAVNIDLRRGKFAKLFGSNSSSRKITEDQPYSLMPGNWSSRTRWNVSSYRSFQGNVRLPLVSKDGARSRDVAFSCTSQLPRFTLDSGDASPWN